VQREHVVNRAQQSHFVDRRWFDRQRVRCNRRTRQTRTRRAFAQHASIDARATFNDARAIMRELIEHDAYMIAQRNDVQSRERDVRRVTMSRDALRYHACDIDTHTRYNDDIDNARLIDHIRNTR
jgi:hypothetical protein